MSEPLTASGAALVKYADHLRECCRFTTGICTCGFYEAIDALDAAISTAARAVDEALSVLGEHEGAGCCDPKTLEHVAQAIRGRS